MIVIKNLSFHYKKDMTILDNIHASLLPGHIYGLLGLNGVGKTTFLKYQALADGRTNKWIRHSGQNTIP